MKKFLAFDIGGTKVKYGILNEGGDILEKGNFNTDVSSCENFMKGIFDTINKYKNEINIDGIALSMPGYIDSDKGIPTVCYAINCMEGKSITKIIEEKTGIKAAVENDGKCVALAEKFNGNAVECKDFVCVTIGTGIGGGIFLNNKLIRGNKFQAGEIGFMVCNGYNEEYKGRETWSTNSSTIALINKYKEYKGIAPEVVIEGQVIFEEGKKDKNVDEIIKWWYKNIALGIFNLCAILNPEKVLIGGGVSARPEFLEELKKVLVTIPCWNDVSAEVELCKHKNDAGLIGAVYNLKLTM